MLERLQGHFVEAFAVPLYTLADVAITIRQLVEMDMDLSVVAGAGGIDRSIRWVHVSELQDPTPWLKGMELLLTTGMGIGESPSLQRAYIDRLVEAGIAGLGFGIGFGFASTPKPLAEAAEHSGFPIIEVPYPVPFVAISEAVSSSVAEDRYREAQLSLRINERLSMLVAEGAGTTDVMVEVSDLTGGWAMLFDRRGEVLGLSGNAPEPGSVWAGLPEGVRTGEGPQSSAEVGPESTTVALVVTAGKRHEGVFVFGKERALDSRDRTVVHQAATVLGLLLASRRTLVTMERRVTGDVLEEAFAGRLAGDESIRRLEMLGFEPGARVAAIVIPAGGLGRTQEAESRWDGLDIDELAWHVDAALGKRARSVRTTSFKSRIVALAAVADPEGLAAEVFPEIEEAALQMGAAPGDVRMGVGVGVAASDVRRSYLSAIFAIEAAPAGQRVAGQGDLGSYAFLLASQTRSALEGFVTSVIGPLLEHDRDRSSELVNSVRAFIKAGGRWEHGADLLGVHRHTLRYRIKQVEDLLGRDLSEAEDRMEIWLALKAAAVLRE